MLTLVATNPGKIAVTDDRALEREEIEILEEVRNRLAPFCKPGTAIDLQTDITHDLSMDSLAVMDLIMELEDRFDVSIPLNTVAEIKTVGDLTDTIGRIRKGQ